MGNDLDEFADNKGAGSLKPASQAWITDVSAEGVELSYANTCLVCDKEVSTETSKAILCSICKDELNLLIKNR